MHGTHPVRFLTQEEGDWSDTGRHHAPVSSRTGLQRSRMRREPSPAYCSSKTELVQMRWIVVLHALAQDLPLPRIRRDFEALQLTHDFQQPTLTAELSAGSD